MRSRPRRTNLLDSLELRRDGLAAVANALPGALADEERRESTGDIAEMMQVFLASDVLLKYRYRPSLQQTLRDEDLEGEVTLPKQARLEFVPDVQWVDPDFVADQIAGLRGTGGGATDETAAPGLHGNGLGTVTLGGVALVPGASATVPLSDDLSFEVQVVNQGENTETDVNVKVTVGEGNDATELEEAIPEIAVGEQQTVTIPLAEQAADRRERPRHRGGRAGARRGEDRQQLRRTSRSSSRADPRRYPQPTWMT